MYNCQLFKYENSWQLRIYDFPIVENEKLDKNSQIKSLDQFDVAEHETDLSFIQDPDNKYCFDGRSQYISLNHSINKIFYYSRSVDWSGGWFVTLTMNPDLVDSFDYHSSVSCLRNFLDQLKRYDNTIKYLFVPEKHKSGRFHFHGLISSVDFFRDDVVVFSGHCFGSDRIYNFKRFWKWGFSSLSRIKNSEAVQRYITKYTTKELLTDTKYQHRYFVSQNILGADILKYNVNGDKLFQLLMSSGYVSFINTDGRYNRVKYMELKNSDEVLHFIKSCTIFRL